MDNQRSEIVRKQRAKIELLSKENRIKKLTSHQEKSKDPAAEDYVVTPKIIVERIQELKPDQKVPSSFTNGKISKSNRVFTVRIVQKFLRLLGWKSQ